GPAGLSPCAATPDRAGADFAAQTRRYTRRRGSEAPMRGSLARLAVVALLTPLATTSPASAAPEGTMTWGLHITLASRWLDPAETEGIVTPFMVLYGLHDALVKPMPAGQQTPSLAESWTQSKDG